MFSNQRTLGLSVRLEWHNGSVALCPPQSFYHLSRSSAVSPTPIGDIANFAYLSQKMHPWESISLNVLLYPRVYCRTCKVGWSVQSRDLLPLRQASTAMPSSSNLKSRWKSRKKLKVAEERNKEDREEKLKSDRKHRSDKKQHGRIRVTTRIYGKGEGAEWHVWQWISNS